MKEKRKPSMLDEIDLRLIKNRFNGDIEAYKKSLAKDQDTIICWRDIENAATIYPELEEAVLNTIIRLLGYLPHPAIRLYYEPALRSVAQLFRNGGISSDELFSQMEEHLKPLRNDEAQTNLNKGYDECIYMIYARTRLTFDLSIKMRLARFLGYSPQLEESLFGSLWLAKGNEGMEIILGERMSDIDLKAINIIKYREVLVAKGVDAANASPLPAMMVWASYDPSLAEPGNTPIHNG